MDQMYSKKFPHIHEFSLGRYIKSFFPEAREERIKKVLIMKGSIFEDMKQKAKMALHTHPRSERKGMKSLIFYIRTKDEPSLSFVDESMMC